MVRRIINEIREGKDRRPYANSFKYDMCHFSNTKRRHPNSAIKEYDRFMKTFGGHC